MKKIILTILIIVAIAALLTLKQPRHNEMPLPDDKPVVKIGVVYPMTGNAAFFGEGAKVAVKLFQEDIENKQTKNKYEIFFEDSQAQPAIGVKAAMKLISYDNIDVMVDCVSGVSAANSQIAQKHQIPHLAFAQDANISKGFYNWRVVTSNGLTGLKMVENLEKKGIQDIVIVAENVATSMSLLDGFISKKNEKINVKNTYYINQGERDFRILLQKIKSDAPQIVLLFAITPEIDIMLRQAKEQEINIPFTSLQSHTWLQDKSLAEGDWYVDVGMVQDDEWLKRYEALANDSNTNFAEGIFVVLQVIFNTYESALGNKKLSSEEFINNLRASDGLKTTLGKLIYDKQNQILDTPASLRIIKNGKIELVGDISRRE